MKTTTFQITCAVINQKHSGRSVTRGLKLVSVDAPWEILFAATLHCIWTFGDQNSALSCAALHCTEAASRTLFSNGRENGYHALVAIFTIAMPPSESAANIRRPWHKAQSSALSKCSQYNRYLSVQCSHGYVYSHRFCSSQSCSSKYSTQLSLNTALLHYMPETFDCSGGRNNGISAFRRMLLLLKTVIEAKVEPATHIQYQQSTEALKSVSRLPLYPPLLPSSK